MSYKYSTCDDIHKTQIEREKITMRVTILLVIEFIAVLMSFTSASRHFKRNRRARKSEYPSCKTHPITDMGQCCKAENGHVMCS